MEFDKLIALNRHIKRRLDIEFNVGVCKFIDTKRRPIQGRPVGCPYAILVPDFVNPDLDANCENTPYFLNHYVGDTFIQGPLSREEVMLMLGINVDSHSEVHAMLRATEGIPGSSNAYILGYNATFPELKKSEFGNFLVVPIQYYSISEEDHASLALTKDEIEREREKFRIAT